MLGILIFIVAILGSIMLHEAGHFATARAFGMKVEEFFVGFGPRLWSVQRGETTYGVKAIPLGGYVRIAGMDPFKDPDPSEIGRTYRSKAPWKRAIVLSAGSFMHFVIAITILVGIFAFAGTRGEATTTLDQVVDDSPAAAAGLLPGDEITSMDGEPIQTWDDFRTQIRSFPGQRVEVGLLREGVSMVLTVTPEPFEFEGETIGRLGVGPVVPIVKQSIPTAFATSFSETGRAAVASLNAFVDLFSPDTIGRLFSVALGRTERSLEDPATLVGVGAQASGLVSSGNMVGLLSLIAAFNIFIGVANMVPLPPLDGGHLAVVAYERVRRREVDMRKLVPISLTVIMVLGSMFMLLLYLDIVKPLPSLG